MKLPERLKLLIQNLAVTASRFAANVQESPQNISRYCRGVQPPAEFLERVYRAYPQLNPIWLITGEGAIWAEGGGAAETRVAEPFRGYRMDPNQEVYTMRLQLAEKERVIQAQQELIQLMKAQMNGRA